jgi:GDSL-like lipase/acylhydrolase family protein
MRKNIVSTTLLGLLAVAIPAAAVDQNLMIVSIGDSLAAGEGNPDSFDPLTNKAGWLSASCHKSVNNGRRFASDRINNLPGVATTFADFSCSGAKIGDPDAFLPGGGLLSPQQTTQPNVNKFLVGAQIDRVRNFQQNTLHGRAIDILMISIGVNDVNFDAVVTACLENTPGGDCTHSDAVNTARNILRSAEFPKEFDDLAGRHRTVERQPRLYHRVSERGHHPAGGFLRITRHRRYFDAGRVEGRQPVFVGQCDGPVEHTDPAGGGPQWLDVRAGSRGHLRDPRILPLTRRYGWAAAGVWGGIVSCSIT